VGFSQHLPTPRTRNVPSQLPHSPWLEEHPEAGYNLENSPHLKRAFVLDVAIQDFSRLLEQGRFNVLNDVRDEAALDVILHIFRADVVSVGEGA
jgi:glycogen debranching enzyme